MAALDYTQPGLVGIHAALSRQGLRSTDVEMISPACKNYKKTIIIEPSSKSRPSPMALTRLPPELLEPIIKLSIPESFDSLTVTCKKIYMICAPFIQEYNALRSRFRNFAYHDSSPASPTIMSASTLIKRIAVEPIAARYIRHADFRHDSPRRHLLPPNFLADSDCREDVIRLVADSPYLKQAGLGWKEYLDWIEEAFNPRSSYDGIPQYSQYAAAFLLTLLPNVESLILPRYWESLGATNRLIDSVIYGSRQASSFHNSPSLAQVVSSSLCCSSGPREYFDLNLASPFLALPHIRHFNGRSCVAMDSLKNIPSKAPGYRFGETLESITLTSSWVDTAGMTRLLSNAKRLKSFRYEHSTKSVGRQYWDVGEFIAAIERQVGTHLTELSVSLGDTLHGTPPCKISFRGFPCLRQLEFPLEVVMCNLPLIATQGSLNDRLEADSDTLLLGDLVPASVSILSFLSNGWDSYKEALDVIIRDFAAKKGTTLPNLKETFLMCPNRMGVAFKNHYAKLLAGAPRTGVKLHLRSTQPLDDMTWMGGS